MCSFFQKFTRSHRMSSGDVKYLKTEEFSEFFRARFVVRVKWVLTS